MACEDFFALMPMRKASATYSMRSRGRARPVRGRWFRGRSGFRQADRPVPGRAGLFCMDSESNGPWPSLRPTDFIWVVRRSLACGNFRRQNAEFGDHVVDRRLERGRVAPPVMSFSARPGCSPPPAWRHLGDREAGGLGGQRRGRDTRGFISMTIISPLSGLMANCTFEPPVSTPISRSTARLALRMIWYSLSVSVCAGATVMESPVCTPIGSKFSIEQMMMQLSARSRTTSISYSFQPSTDSRSAARGSGWSETAFADGDELFFVVGNAAARAAHGERGAMMVG